MWGWLDDADRVEFEGSRNESGDHSPKDGLSRHQTADDLRVSLSTLSKWVIEHRVTEVVSSKHRELARENERLRREIRVLKDLQG